MMNKHAAPTGLSSHINSITKYTSRVRQCGFDAVWHAYRSQNPRKRPEDITAYDLRRVRVGKTEESRVRKLKQKTAQNKATRDGWRQEVQGAAATRREAPPFPVETCNGKKTRRLKKKEALITHITSTK